MLRISNQGIELIKCWEGCRLTAYRDVGGVLTIGYGHTAGVREGGKISQEQAEALLRQDLALFEDRVRSYDHVYSWTQNEFDALVSFAFNIGSIGQLTKYGTRSKVVIAEKLLQYCNATINGKLTKIQGLVNRRQAEHDLFVSGLVPEKQDGEEWYTIQKGDTLTAISKKFKTTVKKLVSLNNIKNPDLIYAGDRMRVN